MKDCKKLWAGCALALAMAAAGAASTPAALTKQAYKAARARIEAQYKTQEAACKRVHGNARDLCRLEAKGHREVARAQIEAQYQPSPEADRQAMDAQADADYALAKARCGSLRDKAKDACVQQAKVRRDAAYRLAVVQKVGKLHALNDRKDDKAPRQETPAQRFAAQKAWCQIQGADRDRCMAELKRRFGKA